MLFLNYWVWGSLFESIVAELVKQYGCRSSLLFLPGSSLLEDSTCQLFSAPCPIRSRAVRHWEAKGDKCWSSFHRPVCLSGWVRSSSLFSKKDDICLLYLLFNLLSYFQNKRRVLCIGNSLKAPAKCIIVKIIYYGHVEWSHRIFILFYFYNKKEFLFVIRTGLENISKWLKFGKEKNY